MLNNYQQESKLLFKLLRNEAFRFIIIRFNHYDLVRKIKTDLQQYFPGRKLHVADAENISYASFIKDYTELGSGFFLLENFQEALRKETTRLKTGNPEMEKRNAQRRDITAGLNLHRDKLAKHPVALIVFILSSVDELYARTIMEKMPDLWSLRSLSLDFKMEIPKVGERGMEGMVSRGEQLNPKFGTLGSGSDEEKMAELSRLENALADASEDAVAYKLTLFLQIIHLLTELGAYEAALNSIQAWRKLAGKDDSKVLEKEAELTMLVSHRKLGDIYLNLGDLDKALEFYEENNALVEAQFKQNPESSSVKSELANSYFYLGKVYAAFGDLEKALGYFLDYSKWTEELILSEPNDVDWKYNLGGSYLVLGETYRMLGDLGKALSFSEEGTKLFEELHGGNPSHLDSKNYLAKSYGELGTIHASLGNLNKALAFFEQNNKLVRELHECYPSHVNFKNNLAMSYGKLGEIHVSFEDWAKALYFLDKDVELAKALHENFPSNLEFKNSLAVSYCVLGNFYKIQSNNEVAQSYLEKAKNLFDVLVEVAPNYARFHDNLKKVAEDLEELK